MLRSSRCHSGCALEDGGLRRQPSFESHFYGLRRQPSVEGLSPCSARPRTGPWPSKQHSTAAQWVSMCCLLFLGMTGMGHLVTTTRVLRQEITDLGRQNDELHRIVSILSDDIAKMKVQGEADSGALRSAERDLAMVRDVAARVDHANSILTAEVEAATTRATSASVMATSASAALADQASSISRIQSAFASPASLMGQQTEQRLLKEQLATLEVKVSAIDDRLAAAMVLPTTTRSATVRPTAPAAVEVVAAAEVARVTPPATPSAAPPTTPPVLSPAAAKSANRVVEVKFEFSAEGLSNKGATLYWLRKGSSEYAYAEISPGGHAFERTYPGDCWRVSDSTTGNHLLSRYCATAEPHQVVRIAAKEQVLVEFAYPQQGTLSAESIEIVETREASELGSSSFKVGTIARGHFLTAPAQAGATFTVRESGTSRLLMQVVATGEERQYVTVGATAVTIEFVAQRNAARSLSLLRVRADGDEHLERSLAAGEAARVHSTVGEEWVLRSQGRRETVVMRATATADSSQRIYIAEPP